MFAPAHPPLDPDKAIRSTDDDAAHARISAVRKGYLEDPFIALLVPRAHLVPTRAPLIHIGTFVRSEAIDTLIKGWISALSPESQVQIVSLGAGSDSRFWRLMSTNLKEHIHKYVEVDFPEIIARKGAAIRKHPRLAGVVGQGMQVERGGLVMTSSIFNLVSADLRQQPDEVLAPLLSILDAQLPTLVLSECVFPYMLPSATSRILEWFTSKFAHPSAISYDMFRLNDPFGRVMRDNLRVRNIELPGVEGLSTLEDVRDRFTRASFETSQALTLKTIRVSFIPAADRRRISMLELVDEIEELELVLDHYSISWAHRSVGEISLSSSLKNWGLSTV